MAGALVQIQDQRGGVLGSAVTDAKGIYIFAGLDLGVASAIVAVSGQARTRKTSISQFCGGFPAQVGGTFFVHEAFLT
jgi:hypothetical protein